MLTYLLTWPLDYYMNRSLSQRGNRVENSCYFDLDIDYILDTLRSSYDWERTRIKFIFI